MLFAINVEDRVAANHPLRPIRRMVDEELARLAPAFAAAYSTAGRPSVPPERPLKRSKASPGRAMLLQCLYSVRSERQLVERLDTGEAAAALMMVDDLCRRGVRVDTLGADKGYDSGPLMLELEGRGITPHVAMNLSGDTRDVVGGRGRRVKADRPKIEARQRMHARLGGEG